MARLDAELVSRGLARSRAQATEMITGRAVRVNGTITTKPATPIRAADRLTAAADPYVSRAAHKLLGALDDLELPVAGLRALDAGASTGGFTQVLLERGCSRVYAVDVGTDQLAGRLRADPRVVARRLNLRDLTLAAVDDRPVDLVVADVSFISLTLLVEPLSRVLAADGRLLLMVKPQFEVGRARLGRGGLVTDPAGHRAAVEQLVAAAEEWGWHPRGAVPSRRPGSGGNREFFVRFEAGRAASLDLARLVGG